MASSSCVSKILFGLGLAADVATQFEKLGVRSLERLLQADLDKLLPFESPDLATLKRVQADVIRSMAAPGENAFYLGRAEASFGKVLSTGVESLDVLLGGGLMTGELSELVGPSSSGKTQVCHAAAVAAAAGQCNSSTPSTVLYIDTCRSFSAARAAEMMRALDGNGARAQRRALARIRCARTRDAFDLISLLDGLWQRLDALCGAVAATASSTTETAAEAFPIKVDEDWLRELRLIVVDDLHHR